jgi:hypothetical protein
MHRPGYVQGGQEAKCGYLLLGIYYRRIPGDITVSFSLEETDSRDALFVYNLWFESRPAAATLYCNVYLVT